MKKDELYVRLPALACCRDDIEKLIEMIVGCYRNGGKLLLCGNGGSAADCEHIAGELLKGFMLKRPVPREDADKLASVSDDGYLSQKLQRGIPAIPLPSLTGVCTAYANDVDAELVYAQEVYALGKPGDLLLGISTSGNSGNVVYAVKTAKAMGLATAALTGGKPSRLSDNADCTVRVPATETYATQELHLPVYHYVCARVERILFGDNL